MTGSAQQDITQDDLEINITEEIVLNKLLKLKEDKAQGPDVIHPAVLRNCAHTVMKPYNNLQ